MEKTKSYVKKVITVTPNGATTTESMFTRWDLTEDNVRNDLRECARVYGARTGDIQSVTECHAVHLLSILYRSGTVKIVSYTEQ